MAKARMPFGVDINILISCSKKQQQISYSKKQLPATDANANKRNHADAEI